VRCTALCLILGACDAGAPPLTGPRPDQVAQAEIHEAATRAQRELDAVAKAVLERYLADRMSVPDSGLLEHEPTVLLDRDLEYDGTGATFTAGALPPGRFAVRSRAEMQADAERTNENVHYIFVHSLKIEGNRATFWVGVHLTIPGHPEGLGNCCCSAEQVYVKKNGAWTYAETTSSVCS
jgi:hypothetical protein